MLTRYGTDVLIGMAVVVVILVALALWSDERWVRIVMLFVAAFLTVFSLNFFRDPDRTPASNSDDVIISPADGKVVLIKDVEETEFIKGRARMISIFMSPLDVHVNRIPASGTVEYLKYIKGKFLVASDEKAVNENERECIGLAVKNKKLLFNQVTGFVARRIVCELKLGDTVRAGERFGMIKFGSRVDIYLPEGSASILVTEGDVVRSGETILAQWQNT
ncbi:MAG TPA: phosphatidylserine decarboxylase family protein [Candidatus Kapabacteria bacterium]|nr:phosphatidylserine decarboxylase family protein [Candidatus Kapabacteria bacterium]